jgi:hypothetical protein
VMTLGIGCYAKSSDDELYDGEMNKPRRATVVSIYLSDTHKTHLPGALRYYINKLFMRHQDTRTRKVLNKEFQNQHSTYVVASMHSCQPESPRARDECVRLDDCIVHPPGRYGDLPLFPLLSLFPSTPPAPPPLFPVLGHRASAISVGREVHRGADLGQQRVFKVAGVQTPYQDDSPLYQCSQSST